MVRLFGWWGAGGVDHGPVTNLKGLVSRSPSDIVANGGGLGGEEVVVVVLFVRRSIIEEKRIEVR